MKYLRSVIIGMVLFLSNTMNAQVSVNVNIGSPPMWGPAGYTEVRYYYLPDVEAYYDVQTSMFIYFGGGVWLHRTYLPSYYSNYDLYGGYKVVMIDYHGDQPYYNFKEYKVKYVKGYRGGLQKTIGQRPGKGNARSTSNDRVNHDSKPNPSHNVKGNSKSNGGPQKNTGSASPHGNINGNGNSGHGNGKKH